MIGPDLIWLSITILAAGLSDKVSQYRSNQASIRVLKSTLTPQQLEQITALLHLDQTADSLISMLSASGFIMFSYVFVAVCVSVFVRQFGWQAPSKPYGFFGIAVPMMLGLVMLALAMRVLTIEMLS
jgi:hypothetical protein